MKNTQHEHTRYHLPLGLVAAVLLLPGLGLTREIPPLLLSTGPPAQERAQGFRPESEHRATPLRKYWLNVPELSGETEAMVLHPLGATDAVALQRGDEGIGLSFMLPMADGPMHGVHNTYVVARTVADGVEVVRVAKWITIHHSCGWGHDYKYDEKRIAPQSLPSIPLEIVCKELWNGNFHIETRSGDRIDVRVLHYGTPVEGARVRLTTARDWTKEAVSGRDGVATFQLIRDHYPERWTEFIANRRDRFTLEATYELNQPGTHAGQAYEKTRFRSTLSWVYATSRKDYTSYESGLLIGTLALTVSGTGIYAYRARRRKPYREVVFRD